MSPSVLDLESHVLSQSSLRGQTVAVTSGSGGIGPEIVRGMAKAGANVALIFHSSVEAGSIAASFTKLYNVRIHAYMSDVRGERFIADTSNQIVQDFAYLDVVIANAGVCSRFDAFDCNMESWTGINRAN